MCCYRYINEGSDFPEFLADASVDTAAVTPVPEESQEALAAPPPPTGTVSGGNMGGEGDAVIQVAHAYTRMCSLAIERLVLLWNVFSHYRMCSLTVECVLLL